MSQAGLEPITEGRFHVHTSAHSDSAPPGSTSFLIEAGRAFGTGQHATTAGCLAMLDRLAASGSSFRTILDLGTGTGVPAFAAVPAFGIRPLPSAILLFPLAVAPPNPSFNQLP